MKKSLTIAVFITIATLSSAQDKQVAEPTDKKEATEKALSQKGYIELPVAESKKASIQTDLDKYSETKKLEDLRSHLYNLQAILAEPKEFSSSMTIRINGTGGEQLNGATFTFTEEGFLDDAVSGQRYQYTVKLKKNKLILVRAKAWIQVWPDRLEATKKNIREKKTTWGK